MPPIAAQTVWIVEDSPLDAAVARRALERDYRIEVFPEGNAALERLAIGVSPEALVVDWVLPGLSGLEIVRFLRADTRYHHLPILLVTAAGAPDQVVTALQAGASDFLSKPLLEPELRARVDALVRARRLIERLEQAESTVRGLLAKAPDALLAIDRHALVTFANDEASRVLGQSAEALAGRHVQELLPGFHIDPHTTEPAGETKRLQDVRMGTRTFAPIVRPLSRETAVGYTVSLRDVTEQRREESGRLDLYSIIAHDLRTPLAAMSLRCAGILRGKHGLLPSGLVSDLQRVESDIRSLVGMINDFLDLARVGASGLPFQREPLELCALCTGAVEELRPLIDAKKQRVSVTTPPAPIAVEADRGRLRQVLGNLLGNAVKFTPSDGAIAVSVQADDDWARITVRDTGPGIPRESLGSIFDRYTRVERMVTDTNAGSGLGLMIVKQVVEAHGGDVGVESAPGEGSAFWFRLPRLPA